MTTTTLIRPAERRRGDGRSRLAERRLLARQDRLTARLMELRSIAELAVGARSVIEAGWIQHSWYSYRTAENEPDGPARNTVAGACLVGAIVHAAGGPQAFNTQLVQRSLDLTWNTLYGVAGDSLAWCPAPAVRTSHLRDLTRWNDQPARTKAEVHDLLMATETETGRLRELIQAQRVPVG